MIINKITTIIYGILNKLKLKINYGKLIEHYHMYIIKKPIVLYDRQYGVKYEFQTDDSYAYYINSNSFSADKKILNYICSNIKKDEIFFDVGACFGSVCLSIAKQNKNNIKIYAIEPELKNYERLINNISINNLENTIIPLRLAIYSNTGIIELKTFPGISNEWNTIGWFELDGHSPTHSEIVTCKSLDELFKELNISTIDWLKIDIEGAEPEAFAGSRKLLEMHAIKRIIFEISIIPLIGMGHNIRDTINPLTDAGYIIYNVTEEGILKGPITNFDNVTFDNFIALAPEMINK